MDHILTIEEYSRMTEELNKVKYRCKCGHKVIIKYNEDKKLCNWCNYYVFKNNQAEFKYRLKEKIR